MNKQLNVLVAVIAVVAILTVVGCASANPQGAQTPVPQSNQLYPGVWVEVIGKGYYNPSCGDLVIDYHPECEPQVPRVGKGKIEPYQGDADDPLNGKWEFGGKYRVHVEYDPEKGIIPGTGWYSREVLRLTDPLPTPTPWPTDTPIPTPTLTVAPKHDTPVVRSTVTCFTYSVVKDDTLYSIVNRRYSKYNLVMAEVIADNPGIDPDSLQIGQKINLCPR